MLSWNDCVALSNLADDEIAVIAEHERLPFMIALEKGADMLHQRWGDAAVRQMVWDTMTAADHHGKPHKAAELRGVFLETCRRHPNPFDRRRAGLARPCHPLPMH